MPLETATYINDLVTSNPAASDGLNNSDDHMRLIKSVLKNTFPGLTGVLTSSSGAILLPTDGTSSLPGYSFASEATLGFYRKSAATIAFTGTLRGIGAAPAGALMDFAMALPPAGWLVCDGQPVSRTTYADLFAAIGTLWGAGDGSTTFNVPQMMSRFRRHRDAGTTYAGNVGLLQNPANLTHTHAVVGATVNSTTDHTHGVNINTGVDSPDHNHGFTAVLSAAANVIAYGGGPNNGTTTASAGTTTGANQRHAHNVLGTTDGISAAHLHQINFASGASGDANESRPFSATVLTCIKV